ncbi:MAG: hypothetical protein ACI9VI_002064 [Candidatus Azotimanducaceae bacterium]|jgi:hypothetical protein
MKKNIIASLLLAISTTVATGTVSAAGEEYTLVRTINEVSARNDNQSFWISSVEGGWGSTTCPTATYAWVATDLNPKFALATALTAKAAGIQVQLWGTCTLNDNHFFIQSILLK